MGRYCEQDSHLDAALESEQDLGNGFLSNILACTTCLKALEDDSSLLSKLCLSDECRKVLKLALEDIQPPPK